MTPTHPADRTQSHCTRDISAQTPTPSPQTAPRPRSQPLPKPSAGTPQQTAPPPRAPSPRYTPSHTALPYVPSA
eukprot:CAMPEP_0184720922 /NCGR_PEP_ID=MMETSP0314-20130426/15857_1 /TAXON_ID=38298 /ORGANISM="Rhodella maculata, Strain CCMP 736" /LENGTH=73 /DNA_ID=CAMNT_0027185151 /DNA_START=216 /DNA_END=434 /DNA_ORIENTATION=+